MLKEISTTTTASTATETVRQIHRETERISIIEAPQTEVVTNRMSQAPTTCTVRPSSLFAKICYVRTLFLCGGEGWFLAASCFCLC